ARPLSRAARRPPGCARGARGPFRGDVRPPGHRRERPRLRRRRARAPRGGEAPLRPDEGRQVSVGILNPTGALALLAVGALVVLYLWDRRRRVVPVATLFLWRQIPARALERRRFRPDLLFLAQLAILLALLGGYLRPFVEQATPAGDRVRLLVVLDTSASMQAREVGGTRFELVRRRARTLVAQLIGGDEVMLVAAA